MVTSLALVKIKLQGVNVYPMVAYFIVQEVAGLFFVASLTENLRVMSLLFKGGFPPFHFWMVKVIRRARDSFVWLLTMQKFPLYVLVPNFVGHKWVTVLFFGSLIPLLQGCYIKTKKLVIFFLLAARGNFMLIVGV